MLRPVVKHVAALTERSKVARPVIGRIVVEMRAGQHDARCTNSQGRGDELAVRSPAMLAAALCPLKADDDRQLTPIDRIEPPVLGRIGITLPPLQRKVGERARCDKLLAALLDKAVADQLRQAAAEPAGRRRDVGPLGNGFSGKAATRVSSIRRAAGGNLEGHRASTSAGERASARPSANRATPASVI